MQQYPAVRSDAVSNAGVANPAKKLATLAPRQVSPFKRKSR
jgi:hypothetical protein